MFARRARRQSCAGIGRIRILKTLTLPDGIVGENDKTIAREESSGVVVDRLALGVVAGSDQNRRMLAACRLPIGKIE